MATSSEQDRPDIIGPDEQGTPGKPDESDTYDKTKRIELPIGTAYVTPLGILGVVGYDVDPDRPFEFADHAALLQFSGAVRREAANR